MRSLRNPIPIFTSTSINFDHRFEAGFYRKKSPIDESIMAKMLSSASTLHSLRNCVNSNALNQFFYSYRIFTCHFETKKIEFIAINKTFKNKNSLQTEKITTVQQYSMKFNFGSNFIQVNYIITE